MNLGNRVFTTSNVEYKEAHRFADLTYSGVYNDETNVNKLNEFNLGLLNFKPLEDSFSTLRDTQIPPCRSNSWNVIFVTTGSAPSMYVVLMCLCSLNVLESM